MNPGIRCGHGQGQPYLLDCRQGPTPSRINQSRLHLVLGPLCYPCIGVYGLLHTLPLSLCLHLGSGLLGPDRQLGRRLQNLVDGTAQERRVQIEMEERLCIQDLDIPEECSWPRDLVAL